MEKTLTLREATPEDMAAIRACHAEIEAQKGEALDLPDVSDPAILGCFVVEEDGKVIGGLYFEKSIRQCHFGTSPKANAVLKQNLPQMLNAAKRAGVRFVHCDVYNDLESAETIGKHLEQIGYVRRDELTDYTVDLRG